MSCIPPVEYIGQGEEGDAAGEDVAAGDCGLSLPPSGVSEQGLSDSQ